MITFLLSLQWLPDLLGRLHPLVVHFPIGLLIGALFLEGWARLRNQQMIYPGLIYLGAASAMVSTLFGVLLKISDSYSGSLVDQHQFYGYGTALISLVTAGLYWYRHRLPNNIPFTGLVISCLSVGITGHLGASLTHGADYLSSVFSKNSGERIDDSILESFQVAIAGDSFPQDQLDRLNMQARTLFAHKCFKCHNSTKRKGDLALDHKEGMLKGGENGPIIVPGNAGDSEIIRRLRLPKHHEDVMPPKGNKLQKSEIELIALWIDQGAHWADSSQNIYREAPLQLVRPELPLSPEHISHPIDKFVHAYFKKEGIKWPDPINDRVFIRRAYLDIVGLLPDPNTVFEFLDNPDPAKREELIENLLADHENYVLHWLSFWNDILRNDYSGTGFITGGRKQITPWLYKALLEGKPYNKMVGELVNPRPESEGFIKGIQWRGEINASQKTELQAAQNISQSLLGLNLKCASCHNSFINNVTLDQAYGFANIFAEEPLEIYRCDKSTGRMAETAFIYPQLGHITASELPGRLEQLEKIMIKPQNGRLYRTLVNRYWDRLFGRGIVAPVDEMDNMPWSEALLDWLTSEFIQHNYDLKKLLTNLMTSKTYQLPAVAYTSPEYLLSDQFVFQGPAVRRLSAEQFTDAISQIFAPVYFGMAYDPLNRNSDAKWIWHEEKKLDRRVLPSPGSCYLHKSFDLSSTQPLISVELLITADETFICYLNGSRISEGTDWRQVQHVEIAPEQLGSENTIMVQVNNGGRIPNPAGLLCSLRIQYGDSSYQYIHSDRSWKSTKDSLGDGWYRSASHEIHWFPAAEVGTFQKSYWGSLVDFNFEIPLKQDPVVRASLVTQDEFMKSMGRPVRENVATKRDMEATLLQSLMLTNSTFFHEIIGRGASSWIEKTGNNLNQLIDELYLHVFARAPSKAERNVLLAQLTKENKQAALEDIIWALLVHPEFQLI